MSHVILERVQYRMPGKGNRLVWAIVLAQREGLSLLFVQAPDDHRSHGLVIAAENPPQRVFQDVQVSCFPLEAGDLAVIGSKLSAISEKFDEADVRRFFSRREEDSW